jgi:hypothetical protein
MGEHDEPENDGQLPFPARKDDQEHVERSEKHGRKSGWVLDAISLILDGISNAFPFLQARGLSRPDVPVACPIRQSSPVSHGYVGTGRHPPDLQSSR